ncbi:nucleotidyl transferase AbiEii/AbiGii toxin family protein [Gracilimonas sediminicola]|uniref:nucleotidyl transferase AbiEii/AbiGii toxin family protein n=1 Tax=Gracilimonas sediminicola TaxID=2952158 RepID=UPI0038D516EF
MILPAEIQQKARDAGVRDTQMEKDYILSWILQGVSNHDHLSEALVFKGGTVLKKVYFEDYRFSEDLDFTLNDSELTNEQIFEWFQEVFEYVREEANIPLELIDNNEHEDGGINFYISYIGPLGGRGNQKSVKVDISRSELLCFDSETRPAIGLYSDQDDFELQCYSLDEVLIEKMRSVMQRMQPRDFYDIWYLLEVEQMDFEFLLPEFSTKCEHKELLSSDFEEALQRRLPQYQARWAGSISDQIQELPEFQQVEREVQRHFRNIEF